jgi:aspartate/methionine/tyrosine aminotransferase
MLSKMAQKLHGETNSLYRLRDELAMQGQAVQDLVSGNINDQGYFFPQEILEKALAHGMRQSQTYKPDPLGRQSAREAVAEYYRHSGFSVDPRSILITPGTSISYWYCFKLLADEGDEILCPRPSYPLFDYIALLSGIKLVPYRLMEMRKWAIDVDQLEASISTRTRALVLISPHNPTGHAASSNEIAELAAIAQRHSLAIISDEVFCEFLMQPGPFPRPIGSPAPLVFTLNGFSKMFALPGIKFGWMVVSGDQDKVQHALRSLELISDTFLPVNEIVQASAPDIFRHGTATNNEFAHRIRGCWNRVKEILTRARHCTFVKPQGGFYVTLHLEDLDETQASEAILRDNHLLVHPGYFYDMDSNHLILSFVQRPETIQNSFPKLLKTLDCQAEDG